VSSLSKRFQEHLVVSEVLLIGAASALPFHALLRASRDIPRRLRFQHLVLAGLPTSRATSGTARGVTVHHRLCHSR
jgi:hypothetical protein